MCCRPCRLSALGWSTWFTTRMRGRLPSAANFHTRSVTASAPACAFTTTSAASTGSIAARVSCRNMWNPGVSSRLIFTPFHSTNAAALAIVVRRATSSSSYAVTAEPSSTCPCVAGHLRRLQQGRNQGCLAAVRMAHYRYVPDVPSEIVLHSLLLFPL